MKRQTPYQKCINTWRSKDSNVRSKSSLSVDTFSNTEIGLVLLLLQLCCYVKEQRLLFEGDQQTRSDWGQVRLVIRDQHCKTRETLADRSLCGMFTFPMKRLWWTIQVILSWQKWQQSCSSSDSRVRVGFKTDLHLFLRDYKLYVTINAKLFENFILFWKYCLLFVIRNQKYFDISFSILRTDFTLSWSM